MVLRKIDLMQRKFGVCDGHTCRECSNFVAVLANDKRLHKCRIYGDTNSTASDWAGRLLACGMFNREYAGRNVIELVTKGRKKPEQPGEPLEGQISMVEGSPYG